jgi:hypothetical protein
MALSTRPTHTFEALGSTFTIDAKYAPIKPLGKGAYGVVVAAKNKETGAKVRCRRDAAREVSHTPQLDGTI